MQIPVDLGGTAVDSVTLPRWLCAAVATLLLAGCYTAAPSPTLEPGPTHWQGGTLVVGTLEGGPFEDQVGTRAYGDPALGDFALTGRCCTLRTPLAYPGSTTEVGGTIVVPDLAVEYPTISRDGLTWTFNLLRGLYYAPPYDNVEIVAQDIVRAAERHTRVNPDLAGTGGGLLVGPFAYVAGAAEFAAGQATTISGLETPDDHTLTVRLTQPYGAFDRLVTATAWAPFPAGAADGHDEDYAYHLVSSGPYMFDGPGSPDAELVRLVRNPTWKRESDSVRGAWVDAIEFRRAGAWPPLDEAIATIDSGNVDLIVQSLDRFSTESRRADSELVSRLAAAETQTLFWIPMNLAAPPFDDGAVRRAANAVIDRAAVRDLILAERDANLFPQAGGPVAQHVFPDSITQGLLAGYAPFKSLGDHGDISRARAEMALSRYDADRDGMCDAPVCSGVVIATQSEATGAEVARSLGQIGIEATVVPWGEGADMGHAPDQVAMQINTFGWVYALHGSDLSALLHGGPEMADADGFTANLSLVGASSEQLSAWGYSVASVPSVDDLIETCDIAAGHRRSECFAQLDQVVTTQIAPWIPIFSLESAHPFSVRVEHFQLDQNSESVGAALDHISLYEGSE